MKTMKLTVLIVAIMIFSVFSVIAAENSDCDVDIAKYASQAKDFINNNPVCRSAGGLRIIRA